MTCGNIEIKKWQDEEYFCARIIIKLNEPYLIKERFISAKNKEEFNREIERVLRTGFDSILH
ncbi:MAG: hypothetical protein HWN66_18175 [Candidatus Helarchaeota archaeon]|nr:hypothetical protein [Candidatus Helarchaeota archaeon]